MPEIGLTIPGPFSAYPCNVILLMFCWPKVICFSDHHSLSYLCLHKNCSLSSRFLDFISSLVITELMISALVNGVAIITRPIGKEMCLLVAHDCWCCQCYRLSVDVRGLSVSVYLVK